MSDLISRQAVNKLVDELARAISDEKCHIQRGRNYGRIMHDILELPSVEPEKCGDCMTVEEYRAKLIETFHKTDHDELIALVVLPIEKDFEHLEWLLKTHYGNREKCNDCISRQAAIDEIEWEEEYGRIDTGKAIGCLEKLPSVESERKPGHWVHMVGFWKCDQCHAEYTDMPTCMGKVIYEYCPMCGSKMEVDT